MPYKSKGTKYKRKYNMTLEQLSEKLNVSITIIMKWEKQGFDIFKKAQEITAFRDYPRLSTVWASMCSRCGNTNNEAYKYYGGKGIKVLLSKKELIGLFIRDGGHKMISPSIHRKDKNGNYEWNNCQFIEMEYHNVLSHLERGHKVNNIP